MKVYVKFLEGIRDRTGEKETEIIINKKENVSLFEFVKILLEKYGDPLKEVIFWKKDHKKIINFLNGQINLEIDQVKFIIKGEIVEFNPKLTLNDQDHVILFVPLAGG